MFEASMIPEAVQKVFNHPGLLSQKWVRFGDRETYNGAQLAVRLWEREFFLKSDDAINYFAKSNVNDCLKTGVSAYTRTA